MPFHYPFIVVMSLFFSSFFGDSVLLEAINYYKNEDVTWYICEVKISGDYLGPNNPFVPALNVTSLIILFL